MKILVLITLLRAFYLFVLLAEGYGIFSDDGSIRLLLSDEWASDPWISSQIPWLPLQFYLVGGLSNLLDVPVRLSGLGLNIFITLSLPWIFSWTLPKEMLKQHRLWAITIVSFFPWALWPGVSGLSDPLMWAFSLAAWKFYQLKNDRGFVIVVILLMMTRIEAWIWAGVLSTGYLYNLFEQKKIARAVIISILLLAWPLFWESHLWFSGRGELAFSMRVVDSNEMYGGQWLLKFLMFPILALVTAPFWIFLWPSLRVNIRDRNTLLILSFTMLYWLATCFISLSTAVPQRNLVLPLLLWCPLLMKRAQPLFIAVILLGQFWMLFHPEKNLRLDLQVERRYLSHGIETFQKKTTLDKNVLVQLQEGAHSYLPRHLAVRGVDKKTLWVDHQPQQHPDHRENEWIKYMTYEESSNTRYPIINYWRSWKPEKSFIDKKSTSEIQEILKDNKIGCVVAPQSINWPEQYGYSSVVKTRDHTLWVIGEFAENDYPEFPFTNIKTTSRIKTLRRLWNEKRLDEETWKALLSLMGI